MPTSEELRSIQKRILAMLITIEQDPSQLPKLIESYSIEMQEEDVALVERKLRRKIL